MKCINCGDENKNSANFCSNCGTKLEQNIQSNQNVSSQNANNSKIPTLSWVSLGFLCMQLFCFFCQNAGFTFKTVHSKASFVFEFPYIIVSLILAIISRVKNKDRMSLAVIIVDAIVIFIVIIFIILAAILFASVINSCSDPNSQLHNAAMDFIDGCRQIG